MNKKNLEELKTNANYVSNLLKSFGHPKRLLILCFLSEAPRSVGELEELCEIGQSQLSQFLKRLELEGILSFKKDGLKSIYSIKDPKALELVKQLNKIFCA